MALAALIAMMMGPAPGAADPLQAQDKQDKDIYLMDLGIIIESGKPDSATAAGTLPPGVTRTVMVGKEPPGAAYIESTRELRAILNDLGGKINTLENSLNQDVEAVRLENERLRTLIRKIQIERREADATRDASEAPADRATGPASLPEPQLPVTASYRHIMQAYRAGFFADVVLLYRALDESVLSKEEQLLVSYWCADALFRQGAFDDALQTLEGISFSDHELGDDAVILRGLVCLRQGKSEEALTHFRAILDHYPASEYHRLAELTIKELNNL